MDFLLSIVVSMIGGAVIGYVCYPFFNPSEYIDADIERAEERRNDRK